MDIHDDNSIFSLSTGKYLDQLPEGFEVLNENLIAPKQPPESPCAQQISALVEGLKDMVNSVRDSDGTSPPGRGSDTRRQESIPDRWDGLLTPDDASAYLRIPKTALNRECRTRSIAYITINRRGDRRFRKEDLDVYLERQTVSVRGSAKVHKDTGKERDKERLPKGDEKNRRIKQDRDITDLRKEIQKLWQ